MEVTLSCSRKFASRNVIVCVPFNGFLCRLFGGCVFSLFLSFSSFLLMVDGVVVGI